MAPSANLKLGQFVTSATESEWATQIGDAYGNFKNSSYFTQAAEYGEKAKEYVSETLSNSETVKKAVDAKDQMVAKFDEWISAKVDTEKLKNMSKAAKKKFWNEFINEVIDEEFDYQQTSKQPVLKASVNQSSYKIGPSQTTLKVGTIVSASMIVVLVSTLQYVLSKYTASLNKVTVLEEANNDPNTRVVTSEQAV